MLRDVPDGAHCFVDANIFYYHLVDTPSLSDDCSDFLNLTSPLLMEYSGSWDSP
jgi:hypothetical protein